MREIIERILGGYYLNEVKDIEDPGLSGKKFERYFVKALRLIGLKFKENIATGPGWDIHPTGGDWSKLITNKKVNIKVYGTKWMLSSSELYKMLPWDKLPKDFDREKYVKKIKSVFSKKGVSQIYFLKAKNKNIQEKIIEGVKAKDVEKVKKLLVKKNFIYEKLGRSYDVKILDNGERVTSVAVLRKGKVFMRSEKPRKMGGVTTVTFRMPTPKISKVIRKIVSRSE